MRYLTMNNIDQSLNASAAVMVPETGETLQPKYADLLGPADEPQPAKAITDWVKGYELGSIEEPAFEFNA
jgi:hypothetical protein